MNNTVLMRDQYGNTDVMVRIPKFKLSDVIDGASDTVHPAFIVGGKEVDEIYISKYQNSIHNRLPYSLPYQKAATQISYTDAVRACALKGRGWHLMSNAEWAAIALWSRKNGTLPHGNTQQGVYHADTNERGMCYNDYFTLTGSGPATWAHDHTADGIFDLCGNVWEWVSGLRIRDGVIQTIADNDVALNVDQSINSAAWQDIIDPSSGKSVKFSCGDDLMLTTGEIVRDWDGTEWENIRTDFEITEQMKALALFPGEPNAGFYADSSDGEWIACRGGVWYNGASAGVFALGLLNARSIVNTYFGFRAAFSHSQILHTYGVRFQYGKKKELASAPMFSISPQARRGNRRKIKTAAKPKVGKSRNPSSAANLKGAFDEADKRIMGTDHDL